MKPTDYKAIRYMVFLLIIVVFSSNKVIGQYDKELSIVKFNKGYEYFKSENYIKADSLFRLSIKLCPISAAYYNLALTKQYLKDKCGYCNYLDSAVQYGNEKAEKLFNQNCVKRDSIIYDNTLRPDTICYSITKIITCSNRKEIKFYIKSIKEDKYTGFGFNESDSLITLAQSKSYYPKYNNVKCNDEKFLIRRNDTIYIIEEMPQFIGEKQRFTEYITKELKYPKLAKENGIYGKVFVYFVINGDGNVEQIEVKRKVNPLLDAEAVRVIKDMPKWKPGMQCGKPVKVAFTVPINFALN